MSKRKTSRGAGIVPAPRGGVDPQAMEATAAELRELLREARGVLGDLVRERKALEQLARGRAEQVIETHVNACINELNRHVSGLVVEYGTSIQHHFAALLDHYMNPAKYGQPDAPSLPDILSAVAVINQAMKAGTMRTPVAEALHQVDPVDGEGAGRVSE